MGRKRLSTSGTPPAEATVAFHSREGIRFVPSQRLYAAHGWILLSDPQLPRAGRKERRGPTFQSHRAKSVRRGLRDCSGRSFCRGDTASQIACVFIEPGPAGGNIDGSPVPAVIFSVFRPDYDLESGTGVALPLSANILSQKSPTATHGCVLKAVVRQSQHDEAACRFCSLFSVSTPVHFT